MDRRRFLIGNAAVAAGSMRVPAAAAPAGSRTPIRPKSPAVLADYTADDHRRRLANIAFCRRGVRRCLRQHLVSGYLPGQCCYNLGEYPCRKPWDPGEYDERELDRLKEQGIGLVQVFDEWNDSLRLFGGTKHTALDPAGFRRFVEMVHRRGMKILAYASPCFFQRTDPEFRPEWAREGDNCVVGYWNMARCSPASPGWRAYLLPRLVRILDDYGVDGLYLDGGYVSNRRKRISAAAKDEIAAFEETPEHDGAFADLLALIYAEVKRRAGILKLHVDAADQPQSGGLRVYDYLWVGEGVGNADGLREATKSYPPYLVPCLDMTFAKVESDDEHYLHAIPYLQFPVLQAGRPFTGERGMVPGVVYPNGANDFWIRRCRAAWEYHQTHPNGPHVYGGWDAVPPRPQTQETFARWLARYRPLVEEGTWAWLEIAESDLTVQPPPKEVCISAFANRELYLALANYGRTPATVETRVAFTSLADDGPREATRWELAPRSLKILRRATKERGERPAS